MRKLRVYALLSIVFFCLLFLHLWVDEARGTARIYRPNADGDALNWDGVYPTSPTTHYDKVDDAGVGDGDATYVYKGTFPPNGIPIELYHVTDPGAGELNDSTINYVRVYSRMRCVGGTTGGTEYVYINGWSSSYWGDPGHTYSGDCDEFSYVQYYTQWNVNPETGVAWTKSDITNLQIGTGKTNGNYTLRDTQVYLYVDFSPPSTGKNSNLLKRQQRK